MISWAGRADLFTKHFTGAMAGEMVVSARHVLFFILFTISTLVLALALALVLVPVLVYVY